MTDYKPKEWQDLEELYRNQNVRICELEEENKKLKELKCIPTNLKTTIRIDKENERLEEENKKMKEDYKVLGILNDEIRRVNENLREENRKLKEQIERLLKIVNENLD